MRVAIIGAGAVGGTLAALIAHQGHDVQVTARGEHAEAIRAHGLRLSGGWGELTAAVEVVDEVIAPVELVILATKAHDSAVALARASAPDGCAVLVVQNGLGGGAAVHDALPASPVALGLALFAASLAEPGHVSVTGPAPLVIGGDAAAVDLALAVLRAALPAEVTVTDDIIGAQWTKLIVNQVNALPAITGLSVQQTVAHDGLRRVLSTAMQEAATVAHALGVTPSTLGGVSAEAVERLRRGTPAEADFLPRQLAAAMGDVPNPASTLQSIRRGRSTEIDALSGAVVAAGRRVGVPTPVSALLTELVHEVEQAGTFLSPKAVLSR